MAARRAVRDATNQTELRTSRGRVNDAKVALGERGHAWWLPPEPAATTRRIEAAVRALLRSREAGRTICPSDVARIVGAATWRTLLPVVRDRVVAMTTRGELEILRRGQVVSERPTERRRTAHAAPPALGPRRPMGPAEAGSPVWSIGDHCLDVRIGQATSLEERLDDRAAAHVPYVTVH